MSVDDAIAWQSLAVVVNARVSHIISCKGHVSVQGTFDRKTNDLLFFRVYLLGGPISNPGCLIIHLGERNDECLYGKHAGWRERGKEMWHRSRVCAMHLWEPG